MNSLDLIRMGVKNLWRRKLRTALTILGVVIGTSSIIVMLSLGFGMSQAFEDQIASWGSLTTINVRKQWSEGNIPGQKIPDLDDKSVSDFKQIPNVEAVSPILETYGTIINGRYISNVPIKGIDPSTMEAFGFEAQEGRLLESGDNLHVVFGSYMANSFYDPSSRVWREIEVDLMRDRMKISLGQTQGNSTMGPSNQNSVKYKEYNIISAGILTEGDWESSYGIYMPISQVEQMIEDKNKAENIRPDRNNKSKYNQINVKVSDSKYVKDIQDFIKESGYEAYSLNDQLDFVKEQTMVIQLVLGGIGAVSLLVAAIGITNTMIMSIYERTKEIGVMKVIGASLKDIKRLFLLESALIGFLGGLVGISFSYGLSFVINKLGANFGANMGAMDAKISIIPLWLALVAMVFSGLIGVISGYFPARRAMNLSALEAIRTE